MTIHSIKLHSSLMLTHFITLLSRFKFLNQRRLNGAVFIRSVFASLLFLPAFAHADFSIKQPCISDNAIAQGDGQRHRFHASLLAFNNQKPRCLLNQPVVNSQQVDEAIITNDIATNDVIVTIRLSACGKKLFADYSRQQTDQAVALMIDDKILAMLTLAGPIVDGNIQIRGLWYEDAVRLSNAVNTR